ncbi:hypothetical protein D3C76_1820880 [compost metagenome]
MENIGKGGQAFLLRETGVPSLDELSARLAATIAAAGDIIDAALADQPAPV